MTEKDLLDSLRFVDDDLIEEAGLEQLKEEKQKKTNGKVIFFRTALTAAAGICIFAAGTVMGIQFRFQRSHWEKKQKVRSVKMRHHIKHCQLRILVV